MRIAQDSARARMWALGACALLAAAALGLAGTAAFAAPDPDSGSMFHAVATRSPEDGLPVVDVIAAADLKPPGTSPDLPKVKAAPVVVAPQENLVTSRKRMERIEEIPVSVQRYGASELRGSQIRRLDDASGQAANLFIGSSMGLSNTARAALRGTGQNDPDSFVDPGVGVYLDGVYLARAQGQLLTLTDMELVEVIRGPQGTVFGKNALGGAINLVTRKPDFELGGEAELRAGNFDLFETRVALNMPLVSEKAAARFAFATKTRDGFVKNIVDGEKYSDDKLLYGRGQLLLLPTPDLEVLLTADNSIENRKPLGSKCVLTGRGTGLSMGAAKVTGLDAACARDEARDDFEFASDLRSARDRLRTFGGSAQISWDVAPGLMLTSVTALRNQLNDRLVDLDSNPVNFLQPQLGDGDAKQSQLSQELRLSGRSQGGRLSYVLGAYAFRDRTIEASFDALSFLTPTMSELRTNNMSYEGFGQLSYGITDRLELTVGLRRTQEHKGVRKNEVELDRAAAVSLPGAESAAIIRGLPEEALRKLADSLKISFERLNVALQDPNLALLLASSQALSALKSRSLPVFSFQRTGSFGEWSPSAALSYQLTPAMLLYASYATGFRSGGFNGRAARAADTQEIDPEVLTSHEIGVKSRWLDGTLSLSAAAFYDIGKDVQLGLLSIDPFFGLAQVIRRNASKQIMKGGELSASWLPLSGLTLRADLGILNTRYADFTVDVPDPRIARQTPVLSPNYTMNLSAQYKVATRPGVVGLRLGWSHTGSYNNDVQATQAIATPRHGLLDGRLSLELPDGRTEIALFGTNLFNRRYVAGGVGFAESFGFATRFFGPPRFYGLEIRRTF